jgi:type IV secretion system protein VirB11
MTSQSCSPESYDKSVTVREMLKQSGLQEFLEQPALTEVRINQPGIVITKSPDGWRSHNAPGCSLRLLRELANAASIFHGGLPLDLNCPIKSIRLPGGQRGQLVIPPACEQDTVAIAFRLGGNERYSIADYVRTERITQFQDVTPHAMDARQVELNDVELALLEAKEKKDMQRFFELCIQNKFTICISGGTGSGKTMFMKALCDLVPADECLITIEDTHELSLPYHWNKVHLFFGDFVSSKDSLRSCMRMAPDRIFLTELRGDEAFDFIAALNTGHPGSLTTVHANSAIEAYQRIATLIKQSEIGRTLDWKDVLRQVTTSIDVMVHFSETRMTQLYFNPIRKIRLQRGDCDA